MLKMYIIEHETWGVCAGIVNKNKIMWLHTGYEYRKEQLKEDILNFLSMDEIEYLYEWEGDGYFDGITFHEWDKKFVRNAIWKDIFKNGHIVNRLHNLKLVVSE